MPTNNLVAVGNHLAERGMRVVLVVEESFEGELERRGFEEALMRMSPPPEHEEQVGEGWAELIRVTAPEFRKPTIEQIPPVFSGYPVGDRTGWEEFRAEYRRLHDPLIASPGRLRGADLIEQLVRAS
jgi:UDP:flavonoid glycosyltransferase YjiC (YdhE family)